MNTTPVYFEELSEDNACINCGDLVDPATPHKILTVNVTQRGGLASGTTETLEEWPLCPTCEQSQPVTLSTYVKLALS